MISNSYFLRCLVAFPNGKFTICNPKFVSHCLNYLSFLPAMCTNYCYLHCYLYWTLTHLSTHIFFHNKEQKQVSKATTTLVHWACFPPQEFTQWGQCEALTLKSTILHKEFFYTENSITLLHEVAKIKIPIQQAYSMWVSKQSFHLESPLLSYFLTVKYSWYLQ